MLWGCILELGLWLLMIIGWLKGNKVLILSFVKLVCCFVDFLFLGEVSEFFIIVENLIVENYKWFGKLLYCSWVW